MLGRILRQNRRWMFGSVMLGLFVALDVLVLHRFSSSYSGDFSDPLFLFSLALAVLIFAGVPTVVFALFFPTMLGMIEILAVGIVVSSVIVALLPAGWQSGYVEVFVLFAVNHLLIKAMGGHFKWLNMPRTARPQHMQFNTKIAPEQVWYKLYPVPGHLDSYFVPGVQVMAAPQGSGADFLCVTPQRRDLGEKSELNFVDSYEPFTHFSVRRKSLADAAPDAPFSTMVVRINALASGGSAVAITCTHANTIIGQRFYWFLIDAVRDTRTCYRARIEGRRDWSIWGTQLPKPAR